MISHQLSNKAQLFRWIQEQTGLHITAVNEGPVLLALKVLATTQRLSQDQYATALMCAQVATQPFFDEITTHESFFLRHHRHMVTAIEEIIRPLLRKGIRPRVLSAPCAQGEEPYSFAMLLQDHGINPAQVEITAVDIAESSIQQAKNGLYRNYALRQVPPDFIQRHFHKSGATYRVYPNIHNAVQFMRMNLLKEANARLVPGYHLIFSHNMLIYFDRATNVEMVSTFKQLLHDDGWLFVDPVETSQPEGVLIGGHLRQQRAFRKKEPINSKSAKLRQAAPYQPTHNKLKSKVATTKNQPQGATDSIEKRRSAKQAYKNKQFKEAINLYNQLIDQHPIWASWARVGKAKVLIDSGEDMEALEEAESALYDKQQRAGIYLTKEDEADAHAIIALVLHRKGLHSAKEEHLKLVHLYNPKHDTLQILR